MLRSYINRAIRKHPLTTKQPVPREHLRFLTRSATINKDYPSDRHVNNKQHTSDPQSEGAAKAKDAKQKGGSDTATSQSDSSGAAQRAKRENPEAPTTIGMQDERGKKGE